MTHSGALSLKNDFPEQALLILTIFTAINGPTGLLAVGAILLTIMGGIAGNIFTMAVHRFRKGDHKETRIIDWILCILVLIFIFIVLAPFAGLIATTNFKSNPTLYIYCLGILFGVVGSTLSDFFIAAYEGSDVREMALIGGSSWCISGTCI